MSKTVIIKKRHCIGRRFQSSNDCPLSTAIKEQLPDFPLKYVAGLTLYDNDYKEYKFHLMPGLLWCAARVRDLISGRLDKYVLSFYE